MITHNQHRYTPPPRYTDRHADTLQLKHSACTPSQPDTQPSAALAHRRAWHILAPAGKQALAGSTNSRDGGVRGLLGSPPRYLSRQHLLFPPRGPCTQHLDRLAQMPGSWAGFAGLGLWPTHPAARTPRLIRTGGGGGGGGKQELSQPSYPLWVLRAAGGKEPSVAQNSSVAVSRLRPGCTLLFLPPPLFCPPFSPLRTLHSPG